MPDELWGRVDRLVDSIRSPDDLRAHRLQLLAARRWREQRVPVPDEIGLDELKAFVRIRDSHTLLDVLVNAYDDPVMVLKGLEIAAYYPAPGLRVVHDLDVLVDDAEAAYAAAVNAGLQPVGPEERYYSGLHHVRPLLHPEHRSVMLEIHRRPNWVPWALAPSALELLSTGQPSRLGVPGIVAPPPEQHAVLVAAHAWGDAPLRRVSDLIDVLALLQHGDPAAADEIAATWGLDRMWQATVLAAKAVIMGETKPWWLSRFAPDIVEVRDRTVFENHFRTWLGPLLALPPRGALTELRYALGSELLPRDAESWGDRARRIGDALRHLNRPNSEHQRLTGERPAVSG